jgi:hypothetical protein
MEFNNIITDFKNIYYSNLLFAANKENIDQELIKIIDIEKENFNNIDKSTDLNLSESNLTENNNFLYQKPWTKLNFIHKVIKIKEYLTSIGIEDSETKNNIKDEIITMIKDKKTKINYDSQNLKILEIPGFKMKST